MQVEQTIKSLFGGGYDANHEWSPDYSKTEQADILDQLFSNWEKYLPQDKALIIKAFQDLVKESYTIFTSLADLAVKHYKKPEFQQAVLPLLNIGYFCSDLLTAQIKAKTNCPVWIEEIKKNIQKKNFIDNRQVTNLKKLYKAVSQLIIQLNNIQGLDHKPQSESNS